MRATTTLTSQVRGENTNGLTRDTAPLSRVGLTPECPPLRVLHLAAGAFDWDLLLERLAEIRAGHAVSVPIYDYKTHSRLAETEEVGQPDVVLLEGILVLFDPRVRAQLDMMLFVDEDSDTRLSRRGSSCNAPCGCRGPALSDF